MFESFRAKRAIYKVYSRGAYLADEYLALQAQKTREYKGILRQDPQSIAKFMGACKNQVEILDHSIDLATASILQGKNKKANVAMGRVVDKLHDIKRMVMLEQGSTQKASLGVLKDQLRDERTLTQELNAMLAEHVHAYHDSRESTAVNSLVFIAGLVLYMAFSGDKSWSSWNDLVKATASGTGSVAYLQAASWALSKMK